MSKPNRSVASATDQAVSGDSVLGVVDEPMYSGVLSFMRRKYSKRLDNPEVDVVVTGVPFDLATTHRPGARFGPAAIRAASAGLAWETTRWPWDFQAFDVLGVIDYGDLGFKPGESPSMIDALQQHAARVLAAGKTLLALGGDHFIALPLLREHARKHGPVALLHFDAHTDTYSNGSAYDHGTMFHHALEEGLLLADSSVQVGIRTDYTRMGHPFTVLDAAWLNDHGSERALEEIRSVIGSNPCYVSFDIDCLDPAFAPGTGTPVCGGISMDFALKLVRGLTSIDIVGIDLVEVAPAYDHAEITSLAAATLALEFLYVLAARKRSAALTGS
jgi:agmatinase